MRMSDAVNEDAKANHRYFLLNKPFNMVSQFRSPDDVPVLASLSFEFPEGTHAIGRLDKDSEGLLILTTNKRVTHLLFNSGIAHERVYLVRLNHSPSEEKLDALRNGVEIRTGVDSTYITRPCLVERLATSPTLAPRDPPLQERGAHTWIRMVLTEGKFRQIRKMIQSIGHRCQRLVRVSIEGLELGDLQPGQIREVAEADFFSALNIDYPS
jgi:23S rRNA pseudouridine2457 synthase